MTAIEKPEGYHSDHKFYLDELRESRETNMFGAGEYLEAVFGISKYDARAYLSYWMKTFGKEEGQ